MSPFDGLATALGIGAGLGAKALARTVSKTGTGLRVAALSEPVARALEQAGHHPLRLKMEGGRLPLPDGAADALCISGFPSTEEAAQILAECVRVVKSGGRLFVATAAGLARRGPERHLVAALLLHAGLLEVEQRLSRGIAVSGGVVRR